MQTITDLIYVADTGRHLVCLPYSHENLHRAASELGIKRCWWHGDHYDIPRRMLDDVLAKCQIVSSKDIVRIIRGTYDEQ